MPKMLLLPLALLGCRRDDVDLVGPAVVPADVFVLDVAAEAGMQDWEHNNRHKHGRTCVVADFDLDGLQDAFVANPYDESVWFRNVSTPGAVRFELGQELADGAVVWGSSAADFDADGDLDLMAALGGFEANERNVLLTSQLVDGQLQWTDATPEYGLGGIFIEAEGREAAGASVSAIWLDYNNDGLLDLYIDESVFPYILANDPLEGPTGRNTLFERQPDGGFVDVTEAMGLDTRSKTHWSSWFDFDNDGDLDLFEVAFRWGDGPNHLYLNEVTHFADRTATAMLDGSDLTYPIESFSSATGDYNNDGWMDLMIFVRGWPEEGPFVEGHVMLLNVEGRGFVDASAEAGLNDPFNPGYRDHLVNGVMGSTTEDLNLDGIPDVFIGNGGPEQGWPNDLYLSTGIVEVDFPEAGTVAVPQYDNMSHLIDFPVDPMPGAPTYPPFPHRTHAACAADLDRDGVRELLVTNGGMMGVFGLGSAEPNRLFRFEVDPKPQFVRVELEGDGDVVHVDAIGARIAVTVLEGGVVRTVHDAILSHNGFGAQHGYERTIGLGQATAIADIAVTWPGGETRSYGSAALGSKVEISY